MLCLLSLLWNELLMDVTHLAWCQTHNNRSINASLLSFPCSGFHIGKTQLLHPSLKQILSFLKALHFHEASQTLFTLVSPFPESLST